jgi:hypothetical protein
MGHAPGRGRASPLGRAIGRGGALLRGRAAEQRGKGPRPHTAPAVPLLTHRAAAAAASGALARRPVLTAQDVALSSSAGRAPPVDPCSHSSAGEGGDTDGDDT